MESDIIRFYSKNAFVGLTGIVDKDNAIVHGVSLITGNMEAEGHDLLIDDVLTDQLLGFAKEDGQVAVYLDHGAGIKELNGYVDNFRRDGNKLRGDWHLLFEHKETPVMLERAERQPKTFGLSVAFKGKGVVVKGMAKKAARAEKLLSVDVVPRPAANKGLFSVKETQIVDKPKIINMNENQEPTLQELRDAINQQNERLEAQQQFIDQIMAQNDPDQQQQQDDQQPDLAELANMTDEQLDQLGFDPERVHAAVQQALESGELTQGDGGDGNDGGDGGNDGGDSNGAMANASAEGQALAALTKRVMAFEKREEQRQIRLSAEAEEIQLQEIQNKVLVVAEQRDEAIQLAANLQAENEALRLHVKTGTRPAASGFYPQTRFFSAKDDGELHEFQMRVKELVDTKQCKTDAEAIRFAQKENPAMHADWVQNQQPKNGARA